MESVARNVADIPFGPGMDTGSSVAFAAQLPAWCNVYEGMSDAEIAEIETSIVRSPGSLDAVDPGSRPTLNAGRD